MTRRPRILFAWEMGENFGHATKITEIARAIGPRADIYVAAQRPDTFAAIASGVDLRIGPAPFARYQQPARAEDQPLAYSDNLAFMGWGDPAPLNRLLDDWDALFSREAPDVLVTQAAPTALLAARGRSFATATLGSGFDTPPRATPMPPFAHWQSGAIANQSPLIARREAAICATANAVLTARGKPRIGTIADVLRSDETYLATLPEVDHYAPRTQFEPDHPPYLGQLFVTDQGAETSWRASHKGHRIFAYLRPERPETTRALEAFQTMASDHDIILAAPGIGEAEAKALTNAGVNVTPGPVRLDRLLPDMDYGINHASNGIAAAFLIAGIPQLCLPSQGEQTMVAVAVSRNNLGLGLAGTFTADHVVAHLQRLFESQEIAASVATKAADIANTGTYSRTAKQIANAILDQAAKSMN